MIERRDNFQGEGSTDGPWPMLRAQPRTFFKTPLCTDLDDLDADVAFIGIPFDQGDQRQARSPVRARRHQGRQGILLRGPLRPTREGGGGILRHRCRRRTAAGHYDGRLRQHRHHPLRGRTKLQESYRCGGEGSGKGLSPSSGGRRPRHHLSCGPGAGPFCSTEHRPISMRTWTIITISRACT